MAGRLAAPASAKSGCSWQRPGLGLGLDRLAERQGVLVLQYIRLVVPGPRASRSAQSWAIASAASPLGMTRLTRPISASRALEIGLVNRVMPDGDAALAMAQDWADRLARGPAFAHAMTKQMLESEHTLALGEAIEAEAL